MLAPMKLILAAMVAAGTAPAAAAWESDPDEKISCKVQAKTGSRFGRKVCKTAKAWRQDAERFRTALADRTRTSLQNTKIITNLPRDTGKLSGF